MPEAEFQMTREELQGMLLLFGVELNADALNKQVQEKLCQLLLQYKDIFTKTPNNSTASTLGTTGLPHER